MRNKILKSTLAVMIVVAVILPTGYGSMNLLAQEPEISAGEKAKLRAKCVVGTKIAKFPFYVYKDGQSSENNFFPSGNMGDFRSAKIDTHSSVIPYEGSSCIKISYENTDDRVYGWAGLYWQYPANNWGTIPEAYDLTGAKRLTFWARGEDGGEMIDKFQVGGISGIYRDSGMAFIGPITLTKGWRKYTIDLEDMDDYIIVNEENKEC